MTRAPELQWKARRHRTWPVLAVLGIALVAGSVLAHWKRELDTSAVRLEQELAKHSTLTPVSPPVQRARLSPTAERQLREQVALLNRDWGGLSGLLAPRSAEVRLLGMDVNPTTGSVRVIGRATTTIVANHYAQSLDARDGALRNVRLLVLERRPDGVRFEVSALWSP